MSHGDTFSQTQILNRVFNKIKNRLRVEGEFTDSGGPPEGAAYFRKSAETADIDYDGEAQLEFANDDSSERTLKLSQIFIDCSGEIRAELFVTTTGNPAGAKNSLGFVAFSPAGSGRVEVRPTSKPEIPFGEFLIVVVKNRNEGDPRAAYGTAEGILLP